MTAPSHTSIQAHAVAPKQPALNRVRKLFRNKPIEKLLYLLAKNKSVHSFGGKLIPGNDLYPAGSIRHAKRKGINYILDISDYQNWLIYFGIISDSPDGLYNLVRPGMTMIDVGGNIGQTAMSLAKLGGPSSIVLSFEPDPVNYARATENLKQNNFPNIHYINMGLGAQKANLPLKIQSPQNRGGNHISLDAGEAGDIHVPVDTLDNMVTQQGLTQVDLVKIDVEGFEMEVVKGAHQTLLQFKPVLYLELDDNNLRRQNASAAGLLSHLYTYGYYITDARTKQRIPENAELKNYHTDIICTQFL